MLIEIDDSYVQWVKQENPELFAPGQDEALRTSNSSRPIAC